MICQCWESLLLLISHVSWSERETNYNEISIVTLKCPCISQERDHGSSYGRLVLERNVNIVYDPISTNIIVLLELMQCASILCILSKPPTEPDCHVLFNSTPIMWNNFSVELAVMQLRILNIQLTHF